MPSLTATAGPGLALMSRGHRPGGGGRDAGGGRRRDARRSVHRHPGQERAERPVVRRQRPARRRAAAGAGADLDRRLPGHHPVGGATGRGAAGAGDRAVGPVPRAVARGHRPAAPTAGCAAQRLTAEADTPPTTSATATPPSGVSPMADSRHAGRRLHRRRPGAHRARHAEQQRARPPAAAGQARAQAAAATTTATRWADIEGDGDAAVITFGSTIGRGARGACARARRRGRARCA
ncbi:MAG: hypothetical protein MZU84_05530 [Sphingobacterium sp.]|nr:hypothetical protein [Sphingobacterium sp.]